MRIVKLSSLRGCKDHVGLWGPDGPLVLAFISSRGFISLSLFSAILSAYLIL